MYHPYYTRHDSPDVSPITSPWRSPRSYHEEPPAHISPQLLSPLSFEEEISSPSPPELKSSRNLRPRRNKAAYDQVEESESESEDSGSEYSPSDSEHPPSRSARLIRYKRHQEPQVRRRSSSHSSISSRGARHHPYSHALDQHSLTWTS